LHHSEQLQKAVSDAVVNHNIWFLTSLLPVAVVEQEKFHLAHGKMAAQVEVAELEIWHLKAFPYF
jgi:hypothetical protein